MIQIWLCSHTLKILTIGYKNPFLITEMTDDVLFRQDLNFDGTLDYMEFMIGHQQAHFDSNQEQAQGQGHAQPERHGRKKQEM